MSFVAIEDTRHNGWAVEKIYLTPEGEGEISRVLFTGKDSDRLAHEYARWKNLGDRPSFIPRGAEVNVISWPTL